MYATDDLSSCAMLIAKVGQMFMKHCLKLFAVFILSVIVSALTIYLEHKLEIFSFFYNIF